MSYNVFALYVNDKLVASSNVNENNIAISFLSKEFHIPNSERFLESLGIQMKFKTDSLIMNQKSYLIKLLSNINSLECKPIDIPVFRKPNPS